MRLLSLFIFISILIGCKTKQVQCDSYTILRIPQSDTLCIESQHIHVESEYLCAYFDDIEIITQDTIEIKIINNNEFSPSLSTSVYCSGNGSSDSKIIK